MKRFAFWSALLSATGSFLWLLPRIKREYREEGHLLGQRWGGAYGLHLLAFVLGVKWRESQQSRPLLTGLGCTAAVLGTALFVSGWRTLPVTDDSALTTSGLKSGGVYRLSRNPQDVGWAITLLGLSLARRSWTGAGLTGLLWAAFITYLPTEEAFLEQTYGEAYRRYKARTPRFLGWRPS
ncbi:methyltransferase family protein [Deinococcus frigens]|uniref:methyltransferase family protein n=1 Tax=Deinococcus frigens TaxID=249403 RepID=UPI000495C23C|nr:isoprenylcysteine carboxylmethyltransferase family protein [Deinococcus frigens]